MTWHSFFDLSTPEHRHLVAAYAVVLGLQFGYFAWTLSGWLRTRPPRDEAAAFLFVIPQGSAVPFASTCSTLQPHRLPTRLDTSAKSPPT